jgi:hypothetical protein
MGEWSYNAPDGGKLVRMPHGLSGYHEEEENIFFPCQELYTDSAICQPLVLLLDHVSHPDSSISHLSTFKCFILLENTEKLGSKSYNPITCQFQKLLLLIWQKTIDSWTESEPLVYQLYCINAFKQQIHATSM